MATSPVTKHIDKIPKRQPFTIVMDPSLKAALCDYCAKVAGVGTPSDVIEREVAKLLRPEAKRLSLPLPSYFRRE